MNQWVPFVGVLSLPVMLVGLVCLFRPIAKIKIPTRKRAAMVFVAGFGAFILAMATPYKYTPAPTKPDLTATSTGKPEAVPDKVPAEPLPEQLPPEPMYASIDGDEYLYGVSLSDDARNAGQVAGQFIAFRYRGVRDGKTTLTSEGMTLRCDENCRVISITDEFGERQHLEFNPASVAGMAFTDAMNGLLVEQPSRSQPTQRRKQATTLGEANRELEQTLKVCGADGCNYAERAILDRN